MITGWASSKILNIYSDELACIARWHFARLGVAAMDPSTFAFVYSIDPIIYRSSTTVVESSRHVSTRAFGG